MPWPDDARADRRRWFSPWSVLAVPGDDRRVVPDDARRPCAAGGVGVIALLVVLAGATPRVRACGRTARRPTRRGSGCDLAVNRFVCGSCSGAAPRPVPWTDCLPGRGCVHCGHPRCRCWFWRCRAATDPDLLAGRDWVRIRYPRTTGASCSAQRCRAGLVGSCRGISTAIRGIPRVGECSLLAPRASSINRSSDDPLKCFGWSRAWTFRLVAVIVAIAWASGHHTCGPRSRLSAGRSDASPAAAGRFERAGRMPLRAPAARPTTSVTRLPLELPARDRASDRVGGQS